MAAESLKNQLEDRDRAVVGQNPWNTIKRAISDYDDKVQGVIREAIQNALDAWARHMEQYDDFDRPLEIEFRITPDGTLIIWDNAGGMTYQTLVDDLFAIDTESKLNGELRQLGEWGRGFHVVSAAVNARETTYVETKHISGEHHFADICKGENSEPTNVEGDEDTDLETEGTRIELENVHEEHLSRLRDRDEFKELVLESFLPAISRDDIDITIRHVVDGETEVIDALEVDLFERDKEDLLRYRETLDSFTTTPVIGGEDDRREYQLKDVHVARTDDVPLEYFPNNGIWLCKSIGTIEGPCMTVHPYLPHVDSFRGDDPKVIGWGNATDFCPDLETNSHWKFPSKKLKNAGLKQFAKSLHFEEFVQEATDEIAEAAIEKSKERVNEIARKTDNFDHLGTGSGGEKTGEGPGDGDNESKPAVFRCLAGDRNFDKGDTITLKVTDANKRGKGTGWWQVDTVVLKSEKYDEEIDLTYASKDYRVDENEENVRDILAEFTHDRDDRLKAEVTLQKLADDPDANAPEPDAPLDTRTASTKIYVGEENPDPTVDGDADVAELISRISTAIATSDDAHWRAVVEQDDNGRYFARINSTHAGWPDPQEDHHEQKMTRRGAIWLTEAIKEEFLLAAAAEADDSNKRRERMESLRNEFDSLIYNIEASFNNR